MKRILFIYKRCYSHFIRKPEQPRWLFELRGRKLRKLGSGVDRDIRFGYLLFGRTVR